MNERVSVYLELEKAFKNDPESFRILIEANTPRQLKSLDAALSHNPWLAHFLRQLVEAARERLATKDQG